MKISTIWQSLSRAVRWHRRKLAALAAAGCMLSVLAVLSPTPPAGVPMVVAARPLAAGAVVAASDLTVVQAPAELTPDGVLDDPESLVGRMLSAPVPRGAPLTELATVSSSTTPAKGELLVPVPVADGSVLGLVRVGDRVTVVAGGQDGQVVTLASRVRVAAVPQRGDDSSGGVLLVACSAEVASRLAAWSTGGGLGIALG